MGQFMNRRLPLRWANLYSTGFHGAGPIYIALEDGAEVSCCSISSGLFILPGTGNDIMNHETHHSVIGCTR
eukprot:scaffold14325_cov75-Skeletonema_dohrnii-CCMP3373.AAC.1